MIKEFKLAALSDIHLAHPRNTTGSVIKCLNAALPDNSETAELDLIVLVGDVFDRLMSFDEADGAESRIWVVHLLQLCEKHNIILRVLEGTPSHDRKQSEIFLTLNTALGSKVNVAYAKTLSIEYIPELDIQVLYVPDEWHGSTDKALTEVKELMQAKGLNKVDLAFLHGQFDYQLPPHIKGKPRHNSEEYLQLVKHYIFIGHIHTFSTHDRIIAQGSLDRLSHGEEGPKGHVRAHFKDGEKNYFFIENKLARIYKTFKCYNLTLEDTLIYLGKKVKNLPADACVRVEAQIGHPVFSNMNELTRMFPTLVWTKHPKGEDAPEELLEDESDQPYHAVTITQENIVSLLMQRITDACTDSMVVCHSEKLLKETIHAGKRSTF